ncbi:unnamed protein product [Rotaria sp. Silwood2]|nr:unnamed protein product [Rotaria sp. Silwood2]
MRIKHAIEGLDNVDQQFQLLVELIVPANKGRSNLLRLAINAETHHLLTSSVFRYYEIYNDLYLTITSGPSDNLVGYLVELDRLNDAIIYFKRREIVDEQKRLMELYDIGREKLIEASNEVIMRHTNPISPNKLLELCRSKTSISIDIDNMEMSELGVFRIIFDWFREHGFQQGLLSTYASKRGTMSCSSLQSGIGRRFSRSSMFDGRSFASKNTLLPPEIEPYNNHNVDNLSSSIRFSSDRETNNYKFLLDAFVILLSRDLDLLFYTFSNEFKSLVFIKLIELPLAYMHEEAQELCKAIEQLPCKIGTGKFAFYGLLSIIRWFHKSKDIFTKLYEINECLRMILEEVQKDSSNLSEDGCVHPLTMHVLSFMEGLRDYEDVITTIRFSGTGEKKKKCLFDLRNYFTDLIQTLRASISTKIEMFVLQNDRTKRAICLLNNTNYLLKQLQSSSLLMMINKMEPSLKLQLEDNLQNSVKAYLKCYTPLIMAMRKMLNYDNMNHFSRSQLSEYDRHKLKESFSTVNAAIDNLRQENQEYIVDDVQLRDHLRTESKKLALNMFKTYYTKFAHKNFSQKPEKYIRYSPVMFESIIDSFFEH